MGRLMTRRENNFKQSSGHAVDPAGNPVSEWDYLNNFFKRYNKVCDSLNSVEQAFLCLTEAARSCHFSQGDAMHATSKLFLVESVESEEQQGATNTVQHLHANVKRKCLNCLPFKLVISSLAC